MYKKHLNITFSDRPISITNRLVCTERSMFIKTLTYANENVFSHKIVPHKSHLHKRVLCLMLTEVAMEGVLSTCVASPCQTLCELLAWRRVYAYSWPNPSISGTAHAQCAEGLHFSAFHYNGNNTVSMLLIANLNFTYMSNLFVKLLHIWHIIYVCTINPIAIWSLNLSTHCT